MTADTRGDAAADGVPRHNNNRGGAAEWADRVSQHKVQI